MYKKMPCNIDKSPAEVSIYKSGKGKIISKKITQEKSEASELQESVKGEIERDLTGDNEERNFQ